MKIRYGLCCVFSTVPIKFRRTTAKHLLSLPQLKRSARLSEICLHNAAALEQALDFCRNNAIGAFRINSQILPVKTHPEVGYAIEDLPNFDAIVAAFKRCGEFSRQHDIRTSFHPDQFVVLNSPRVDVVERSIAELAYQAQVAQWVNADVINLHGGGGYGNKPAALKRLAQCIRKLPKSIRSRLTLENDDRVFTPADLLPICIQTGIPFVYDVHHHRCLPDGTDVGQTTEAALSTWNREPLFHLSSPINGWDGPHTRSHHDVIDVSDFPCEWRDLSLTVDIEAKAKEPAIFKLRKELPLWIETHCQPSK